MNLKSNLSPQTYSSINLRQVYQFTIFHFSAIRSQRDRVCDGGKLRAAWLPSIVLSS